MQACKKEKKNEGEESILDANLVAFNILTTTIRNLSDQMTRNTEKKRRQEALLELSCALSKTTDGINRMRTVLVEVINKERRREERWNEMERRRKEERRKV